MRIHRLAVAVAAVVAAASCSSTKGNSSAKPTIKMAHNDWLSAELNDTVAQILLQEQMGYTVEFVNETTDQQWPDVSKGIVHVSLEVWPSGHPAAIAQYVQGDHSVEDAGLLGPVATVGWFIPTYLLTQHPELATWEGLKSPSSVALFMTADTKPKGRFVNGDPKWVQWDQKILDNLGLPYTVVFTGSEDSELAALDQAYQARAPFLFYFWAPHWVFATKDLTMVTLPTYSPDLWAKQDCSYPSDNLFKIVWPQLQTYAPEVYRFFKAMSYTAGDQVQMMNDAHNGTPIDQAARTWINTHGSVWQAWITAAHASGGAGP